MSKNIFSNKCTSKFSYPIKAACQTNCSGLSGLHKKNRNFACLTNIVFLKKGSSFAISGSPRYNFLLSSKVNHFCAPTILKDSISWLTQNELERSGYLSVWWQVDRIWFLTSSKHIYLYIVSHIHTWNLSWRINSSPLNFVSRAHK